MNIKISMMMMTVKWVNICYFLQPFGLLYCCYKSWSCHYSCRLASCRPRCCWCCRLVDVGRKIRPSRHAILFRRRRRPPRAADGRERGERGKEDGSCEGLTVLQVAEASTPHREDGHRYVMQRRCRHNLQQRIAGFKQRRLP